MSTTGDDAVFLALGMVAAPFAREKRDQIRSTMLRYSSVVEKRIAFRFLVGDSIHESPSPRLRAALQVDFYPALKQRMQALREELRTHDDILELDALDGADIDKTCSCLEKQNSWVRYALQKWPMAAYIGKSEDDTYIQLNVLEAELRSLTGYQNLLYGYMTLAVLPTRPTQRPERFPKAACVTAALNCRKDLAKPGGRRRQYTEGCFLGDLESKLNVPAKLQSQGQVVRIQQSSKVSKEDAESPLLGWWRGAARDCNFDETAADTAHPQPSQLRPGSCRHGRRRCRAALDEASPNVTSSNEAFARPSSTMAPFPTGPLAIFGRDLATAMFVDCEYAKEYEQQARLWGKRTLCSGPKAHLSFASTMCDAILSHWLAMCNIDATIAHTTRTKSHHYMWRGAGLGWMPPSNVSLAVHGLKVQPSKPSGPNSTVGGEWNHVHSTLAPTTRVAFPPLLYRMKAGYSLNVSHTRKLLRSLNPEVFHWYASECSFEHAMLRQAVASRAYRVTMSIRGYPKPVGMPDAKYIGGHPPGWPFSGCNPSRFRPYPRWPPSMRLQEAMRDANEHDPGSDRFIYFGHGPNASEIEQAVITKLEPALEPHLKKGGLNALKPAEFSQLVRRALAPYVSSSTSLNQLLHALRRRPNIKEAARRDLLVEYIHARLSLEAWADEVMRLNAAGLVAENATRDNTFYYRWV